MIAFLTPTEKTFRILFFLFIVLTVAGQFQRIQLTQQVAIYGHEIILILWVMTFYKQLFPVLKSYWQWLRRSRWPRVFLIFTVFQTIFFTILTWQFTPLLYLTRIFLYFLIVPLLQLGVEQQWVGKKQISSAIILIGFGYAVLGIAQYFFIPDTRFLIFSGWDDHYYRLISTLFDPNFTALLIGVSVLWLLNLRKTSFSLTQKILFSCFCTGALLLTYSRAGYLAFIVGLLTTAIIQRKIFPLFLTIFIIMGIPLLPRPAGEGVRLERTSSIHSRVESNVNALNSLQPLQWIIGKGLYVSEKIPSPYINHATTPDNSFIFLFTSLGIVGSVLVLGTLYEFRSLFTPQTLPIFLAIATHSMFNNTLFYNFTLIYLFFIISITLQGEYGKP